MWPCTGTTTAYWRGVWHTSPPVRAVSLSSLTDDLLNRVASVCHTYSSRPINPSYRSLLSWLYALLPLLFPLWPLLSIIFVNAYLSTVFFIMYELCFKGTLIVFIFTCMLFLDAHSLSSSSMVQLLPLKSKYSVSFSSHNMYLSSEVQIQNSSSLLNLSKWIPDNSNIYPKWIFFPNLHNLQHTQHTLFYTF